MAGIPLNTFKTVTSEITTETANVYTTPLGVTTIILMAQVANLTDDTHNVTASHYSTGSSTNTELVKNFDIPGRDAASVLTGKLVVQTGDQFRLFGSSNATMKVTLSILETSNE